jgi:quercetin dioxygenase-like cupin family protein
VKDTRIDLGHGAKELNETVAYQPNGVVSRVLARTPAGSITAFAFDAGTGLDEHSTPQTAFVEVLEGSALVTIEGEPHQVHAGQIIHLPADVPHALQATERFRMLLTLFKNTEAR